MTNILDAKVASIAEYKVVMMLSETSLSLMTAFNSGKFDETNNPTMGAKINNTAKPPRIKKITLIS